MLRLLKGLVALVVLAAAAVMIGRWMFPLPDLTGRPPEMAIAASAETRLGRAMSDGMRDHPGQSGILPLADGHDALASRLALIDQAQASIDVQYYIWHADTAGVMMLDALQRAARRGVRVRLLLDDNGIPGLDPILAALDAEPGLSIRLFNPSTVRRPKLLGYALDFLRLNRRMHNKALIVDGAAAILGGRNIGDEYFQISQDYFVDMDVLALGTVVPEVAASFDAYWNSASVFALDSLVGGPGDADGFAARVAAMRADPLAQDLGARMADSVSAYLARAVPLEWTQVRLFADDPAKGLGQAPRDQLMLARLAPVIAGTQRRFDLVSAYFIPGEVGTEALSALAAQGRAVRVLTNAMDTTDVLMVHAGYARYRRALLSAGVELFEMNLRGAGPRSVQATPRIAPLGLSGGSLHAKTFAIDDRLVFVGSFNFDPRSALLNCEMGFVIESPTLAERVHAAFDQQIPAVSYRPEITADDRMVWHETRPDGQVVTWQQEPGASWLDQALLGLVQRLPVEWLL
ncbi:MAG: phospholipase D family protein [Rhodobacter sp.]|uniref:phospholipase D family protein n=1 Tax=Pararhodobacter sp. TaxID=2127056 RepID=UPI001D3E908B|nr:phospholipase D family protein [Pararhodobacter sp.]MCB1346400.1 phospholipase D family protein [Paracoccaceae bacterium]MCB1408760.1 phospholipase D family protein [Paracoccaceae bacterium]MCC0073773.1 phospholipase D family protein [Rhodobacter sp.]